MEQGLSGGTTNLLRMARSGCRSASSFVALSLADDSFATAVYPADPEPGAVDLATVDAVVRQLWHDPGLGRGKALVRTVRAGSERMAVAVVPLGLDDDGQPSGILGVADPGVTSFGLPDIELLSRIAQRLTSYVRARRTVRLRLSQPTEPAAPSTATSTAEPTGAPTPQSIPSTQAAVPTAAGSGGSEAARPTAGLRSERSGRPGSWPGSLPHPPFPPPAGTTGVGQPPGPLGGSWTRGLPFDVPQQRTAPSGAGAGTPGSRAGTPLEAQDVPPASGRAGTKEPSGSQKAEPRRGAPADDALEALLTQEHDIAGLVPLGALLGRAGRLLGASTMASGSLAVIAVGVEGVPESRDQVTEIARSIRSGLRFDDPVARIGAVSFVAVVPLAPGAATAQQVEDHLCGRIRAAVGQQGSSAARVRGAHVVAPLSGGQDADELLRAAVVKLRAS